MKFEQLILSVRDGILYIKCQIKGVSHPGCSQGFYLMPVVLFLKIFPNSVSTQINRVLPGCNCLSQSLGTLQDSLKVIYVYEQVLKEMN